MRNTYFVLSYEKNTNREDTIGNWKLKILYDFKQKDRWTDRQTDNHNNTHINVNVLSKTKQQ